MSRTAPLTIVVLLTHELRLAAEALRQVQEIVLDDQHPPEAKGAAIRNSLKACTAALWDLTLPENAKSPIVVIDMPRRRR